MLDKNITIEWKKLQVSKKKIKIKITNSKKKFNVIKFEKIQVFNKKFKKFKVSWKRFKNIYKLTIFLN